MPKCVWEAGISLLFLSVTSTAGMAADKQVIAPFVDGMTITTSNSVANVEIRAQSFGPGFCAVEFSTNGKVLPILAPPLKYSGWKVLLFHIGKSHITITDDVKCDTGIQAQVRYYKDDQ